MFIGEYYGGTFSVDNSSFWQIVKNKHHKQAIPNKNRNKQTKYTKQDSL